MDGYGNRRVIVFDLETGAYKRYWEADGSDALRRQAGCYDPAAAPSHQFANPVPCAKPSKDGMVYVCDRTNNRIQVFKKDGTFMTEWFYDKPHAWAPARVWDLNFWPDANQTWLFNIDGENNLLRILQRSDGQGRRQLRPLGPPGRQLPLGPQHRRQNSKATSTRAKSTTGSACRSSSRTGRHSVDSTTSTPNTAVIPSAASISPHQDQRGRPKSGFDC